MTVTAEKEYGILFSAPMILAILENRKTQTRRTVKPQPEQSDSDPELWHFPTRRGYTTNERIEEVYEKNKLISTRRFKQSVSDRLMEKPKYWVGQRLWVREALRLSTEHANAYYAADSKGVGNKVWAKIKEREYVRPYLPPIHMPRWASRITLEVMEVRVERVQDISAKDIIAEGVVARSHNVEAFAMVGENPKCPVGWDDVCYPDLKTLWAATWERINGKGSWETNPWCWAITFKRLD